MRPKNPFQTLKPCNPFLTSKFINVNHRNQTFHSSNLLQNLQFHLKTLKNPLSCFNLFFHSTRFLSITPQRSSFHPHQPPSFHLAPLQLVHLPTLIQRAYKTYSAIYQINFIFSLKDFSHYCMEIGITRFACCQLCRAENMPATWNSFFLIMSCETTS